MIQASDNKKKVSEKILYIEGLRGLAMVVVVLNHFAAAFYPAIIFGEQAPMHIFFESFIYKTPLGIFFSGIFALSIFFLLSGYLLSYKFFKFNHEVPLISSMVKRYLRFMIPSLISILTAYILLKYNLLYNVSVASITGSSIWFARFWNFEANFFNAVTEGVFMTSVFIAHATYNPVLWMMAYELAGSLLVYIVLKLFKLIRNKTLIYILLFFLTWKSYLLGFVLGVLICDLENRSFLNISEYSKKIIGVFLLILAIFLGSFPIASTTNTIYNFIKIPILSDSENIIFLHTIAVSLIFLAIKNIDKLRNILETSLFRFLGEISFSVYFLHPLIIASLSSILFSMLINSLTYNQSVLVTFLISYPVILGISFYFNKYIILNSLRFADAVKGFIDKRYNI